MSQLMNHPKKGECITVDAIRDLGDLVEIKDWLSDSPRNLALFVLGINTSLRASDLSGLKVGQFRGLEIGDALLLKVKKTRKNHRLTLNETALKVIAPLMDAPDDAYLFRSNKGGGRLTVPTLSTMVKGWCKDCGLKGNYGSHSLRKTWAYHQLFTFGSSEEVISEALGHVSVRVTRRYLGIQPANIQALYMNEL